jgi:hypothetical protein
MEANYISHGATIASADLAYIDAELNIVVLGILDHLPSACFTRGGASARGVTILESGTCR